MLIRLEDIQDALEVQYIYLNVKRRKCECEIVIYNLDIN